jgi:hypothetical protein
LDRIAGHFLGVHFICLLYSVHKEKNCDSQELVSG